MTIKYKLLRWLYNYISAWLLLIDAIISIVSFGTHNPMYCSSFRWWKTEILFKMKEVEREDIFSAATERIRLDNERMK